MDSLTQAVLGAAVGEAVAGRRVGRRALAVGALAGTLPDLDVLASAVLSEPAMLHFHRGPTHSLLFAFAAAPALGWLTARLRPRGGAHHPDGRAEQVGRGGVHRSAALKPSMLRVGSSKTCAASNAATGSQPPCPRFVRFPTAYVLGATRQRNT